MVRGRADGEIAGRSETPDLLMNLVFLLFHTENGYFKRLRMSVLVDPDATVQGK